jgi:hypothetical protein
VMQMTARRGVVEPEELAAREPLAPQKLVV